ncbi:Uncharacterised protein [Pseudomonas aeruginosa]|nr:Uncharacterised protein [Pseudomonas aeruginosa]
MRPCTRAGNDADSRLMARAAPHSISAFRRVLPDSRMIQSTISSRRRSNTSTTLYSTAARAEGPSAAQAGWTSAALA